MTLERLLRILAVYSVVLAVCALGLVWFLRVDRSRAPRGPYIVSLWRGGNRLARAVVAADPEHATLDGETRGATRLIEQLIDDAPILAKDPLIFAGSLVSARDGLSVSYRGKTAYATPTDIERLDAYEAHVQFGPLELIVGIDLERVIGSLARELAASPAELFRYGTFRRFAVHDSSGYPRELGPEQVNAKTVRAAVLAAAQYLRRVQHPDGSFRYEIDALTGADTPGYNYPRHSGATYFLARAGRVLIDSAITDSARRAGAFLRDHATLHCGEHVCIGEGQQVDLGSSALALLAYVELVEGGAPEFREPAAKLADFVRSLQRPDGEFKHVYSIAENHAVDVQFEYYTGEAALALGAAHRLSGDARDLDGASRALARLTHKNPLFVGARYFWAAEHWTCQTLDALWARAPDAKALKFCLDWQAENRTAQLTSPPQYDGAIGRGPFLVPRLTPLASRLEAAVATLHAARVAHTDAREVAALEDEIKRGMAFLLRYQFAPGPSYLFPDARTLQGGVPGSPIEMKVRIDYPQHAGCAMLRYLELLTG
ncbi:MAG TPA: hypothetical protein VGM29_01590 [Polyangiaceae bacterium]|jgi:hypothetical protein